MEDKAIQNLQDLVDIQCSNGNWNFCEYMRGMANGMILMLATLKRKEPEYFDEPEQYLCDRGKLSCRCPKCGDTHMTEPEAPSTPTEAKE